MRREGGLHFKTAQQTTTTLCRRPLQHFAAILSFDAAAEEGRGGGGGRGLDLRIVSGGFQPAPLKDGFWLLFVTCEQKMERTWTNVLVLLVVYQSKFEPGPLRGSAVPRVLNAFIGPPFRDDLWTQAAAEGGRSGGHSVPTTQQPRKPDRLVPGAEQS